MNDTRKRWIQGIVLMTAILVYAGSCNSSSTTPAPVSSQGDDASDAVPQGGGSTWSADGAILAPHAPVPWSSVQAPAHPQVLFDAARLNALRAARTTPAYALIHNFASAWLDWQANRPDRGLGADGWYSSVGGY